MIKPHSLEYHLMASLLELVIFLLAAMDHLFMGKISVSPESFQLVYERLTKPDEIARYNNAQTR